MDILSFFLIVAVVAVVFAVCVFSVCVYMKRLCEKNTFKMQSTALNSSQRSLVLLSILFSASFRISNKTHTDREGERYTHQYIVNGVYLDTLSA